MELTETVTTEGETFVAIVWASILEPLLIVISVRLVEQLPLFAAYNAFVRLSTQI